MDYQSALSEIKSTKKAMRLPEWDSYTSIVWSTHGNWFAVRNARYQSACILKSGYIKKLGFDKWPERLDWEIFGY